MGLIFLESLPGPKIYKCSLCKAHSASHDAIISKDFHGSYGPAYLFESVVNICLGPEEERQLLTGLHTVNDIYCCCCQQILGWRYEKAYEDSQKYKEGKYILEIARMSKEGWKRSMKAARNTKKGIISLRLLGCRKRAGDINGYAGTRPTAAEQVHQALQF